MSPLKGSNSKNGGYYLTSNPIGELPLRGYEIAFYAGGRNTSYFFSLRHDGTNGNKDEFIYRRGSFNSAEEPYWTLDNYSFYTNAFSGDDTVPIYELKSEINNNRYYTTNLADTARLGYKSQGILFYGYAVPQNNVTPRAEIPTTVNRTSFTVNTNDWVLNQSGTGYTIQIGNFVQNLELNLVVSLSLRGDWITVPNPRGTPTRVSQEIIAIPGSYQNNNYQYFISNGILVITCNNISNTPPATIVDFDLTYQ